jgi:diaminopimelate epimerase
MTHIHFTKMHGLGNDFLLINNIDQRIDIKSFSFSLMANRHLGIGCDQILIIEPSKKADFFCRIFNADGSEATQCGNGLRCAARYLFDEKWQTQPSFQIETLAGIFPVSIENDTVCIEIGIPDLKENNLFLMIDGNSFGPFCHLALGNPHLIFKVDSLIQSDKLFMKLAPQLSIHTQFPDHINVGFMEVVDRNQIRLRTFERGSGETFSCGSNSSAAVACGILTGLLDKRVSVLSRFGALQVNWPQQNTSIQLSGPAVKIFEGII